MSDYQVPPEVVFERESFRVVRFGKKHEYDADQFGIEVSGHVDAMGVRVWNMVPIDVHENRALRDWMVDQIGKLAVAMRESQQRVMQTQGQVQTLRQEIEILKRAK